MHYISVDALAYIMSKWQHGLQWIMRV